ncbi:MAG: type II toxin-antitoxin system death-on-curing family toxin [Kingella sp. (in: b-proteobacteria)]
MNYLTQADLIKLHNRVISVSGGLVGMRDVAILDSILSHMQNDEYYPDFFAKLSHLIFSINKMHAFNDGNKRTSIMAGVQFLLINGYPFDRVEKFAISMEDIAVEIAENKISKEKLKILIKLMLSR